MQDEHDRFETRPVPAQKNIKVFVNIRLTSA